MSRLMAQRNKYNEWFLVEADQADITKSGLEYNLFWLQSPVEKKEKKKDKIYFSPSVNIWTRF